MKEDSNKGLWLCPSLDVVSEAWMGRMIQALGGEYLERIVVIDPADQDAYAGVPITSIGNNLPRWCSRLRKYVPAFVGRRIAWNAQQRALYELLLRHSPDFVFANFIDRTIPLRKALIRSGVRVFIHAHGYDCFPDLRRSDGSGRRRHPRGYRREFAKLGDWATIVANSQFTKRLLTSNGIAEGAIVVKRFGVPIPAERSRSFDRSRPIRILLFGRLVDFKGPCEATNAFVQAVRQGLNATLTIAGDGPEADAVEEIVQSSGLAGRIRIVGAVSPVNVPDLMRSHDVFLAHAMLGRVTGQMEAFGVAYIEAMAHGLPVVGTCSGGPAEIVEHEASGFLSEPGDVEGQARNLLRLIEPGVVPRLARRAYLEARKRFDCAQEQAFLRSLVRSSIPITQD